MPNAKISLLASIAVAVLLTACTAKLPAWNEGKLVVIVPATASSAEAEFNRELLKLFAEELHSELVLVPAQREKIDRLLKKHRGHFAASSSRSVIKPSGLHYGPSYQTVREYAVCNREGNRVRNKKDLVGVSLAVISGSSQDAALREAQKELPTLHWNTVHAETTAKMLEDVSNGLYDCAAANELQLAKHATITPICMQPQSSPHLRIWRGVFPMMSTRNCCNAAKRFLRGSKKTAH
jgi:membrane-bound lytic murein transglycosylase MltF